MEKLLSLWGLGVDRQRFRIRGEGVLALETELAWELELAQGSERVLVEQVQAQEQDVQELLLAPEPDHPKSE